MKFAILFCLVSFVKIDCSAQNTNSFGDYLKRLGESEEGDQNHLIVAQLKYTCYSQGKTINTPGAMLNLGINFARFFSKKIIFGIGVDFKPFPGIISLKTSSQFRQDFEDNFIFPQANQQDSANAQVYYSNFIHGGIIGHNMFNVGLMFSLFPQKYGGILLEVKTGNTGYQFHNNIFGNEFVNSGDNDKVGMRVNKNWRAELSFKPLAFFRNTYYDSYSKAGSGMLNSIVIGFYYECLNFQSADFNGTPLHSVVKQPFIDKYGVDHRFGVKVGLAFY